MERLSVENSRVVQLKKFGRTWWGELWLNAFEGIDYSNRLPRGRSYAKPERVHSLEINGGKVSAEVQGRRRSPYKVAISLKPFNKTEKKRLLDAIKDNPHAIGKLLNGDLPSHIYQLAQRSKIELLPTAWRSVNGRCSCPDWAVPCKHLAAVVYLLSIEIDKNPFLIFELHGMDLLGEIQSLTGAITQSDAFYPNPFKEQEAVIKEPASEKSTLQLLELDLSVVRDLAERIFGLLTSEPLFYAKDFRSELQKQYKRTSRLVARFRGASDEDPMQIRDFRGKSLVLDEVGAFECVIDDHGNKSHATIDAWIDELACLRSTGAKSVNDGDAYAVFWYVLYRFAQVLLERNAYVPLVRVFSQKEATIGWQPASLDASVTETLERIYECCPSELVFIARQEKNSIHRRKPDQKSQVDIALSVLLSYGIRQAFGDKAAKNANELMQQWFFTGQLFRFEWFGVADTPIVVQRWLNCLSLRDREHQILLLVEEEEEADASLDYADMDDEEPAVRELITTQLQISLDLKIQIKDTLHTVAEIVSHEASIAGSAKILSDLTFLTSYLPDLEQFLRDADYSDDSKITYSLEEFAPVLLNSLPVLELLGVKLVLPKSLNKLLRPQLNLKVTKTAQGSARTFLDLQKVISFDWQIALGDVSVTPEEFRQLVSSVSGLVRIRDQYVLLNHDEVESIAKRIENLPPSLSSLELLKGHLTNELDDASIDIDRSIQKLLEESISSKQISIPKRLTADLRPYQRLGFEWLVHNARMGFGSILADDMGLGKTVQVIAFLLHQKEHQEIKNVDALVVLPTSLITNWRKELERFASSLTVHVYYGPQRKLPKKTYDVVLTSYGTLRSDVEILSKRKFRTFIVDEAQTIKNPTAQQTRAIKKIRADVRIALSGTPVENRLLDYWSIFDFTMRGYLGTKTAFQSKLATPIELERDQACLEKFRKLTAPFILRRLKTDKSIIKDLPEKIESDRFCTLTPDQASLYQNTIDSLEDSLADVESEFERSGYLFKLIMALKQICNAPSQFLHRAYSGSDESGKLALFVDILGEALEADEKVLVFSQFKQMGDLLVDCMKNEFGMETPFIHGQLSRKRRDENVEAFQNDSRVRAMILSLKAGGTGLNLTAASQVVHYDLWWNPAVETQATDRAYRIGQTKNVLVHRLLTENTFEERINEMLQSKRDLAEMTVTDGELSITDLSNDEIRELVALG